MPKQICGIEKLDEKQPRTMSQQLAERAERVDNEADERCGKPRKTITGYLTEASLVPRDESRVLFTPSP